MVKIPYERAGIDIVTVRTHANFFIGMKWMYR